MQNAKAVLTGSFGVGKTSLFNRFVFQKFSDSYQMTVGVRVEKKVITSNGEQVNIILWDIEGEAKQEKVPTAYFWGASSIIYVFDLARPSTYFGLQSNISYLQQIVPKASIKIIANKSDLVSKEDIQKIQEILSYPIDLITSAKSGQNVEALFQSIGRSMLLPSK